MVSFAYRTLPAGVLVVLFAGTLNAQPAERNAAAARQATEVAEIRLRLYERVDYVVRLKRLESEIKLAEAGVASLKRVRDEYRRFDRLKYSSPLMLSREKIELDLLAAELHLKNLREERLLLRRYHLDERRLLELEVERARDRERALQGNAPPRPISIQPKAHVAAK